MLLPKLLLFPLLAQAGEQAPAPVTPPPAAVTAAPAAPSSKGDREDLYEENGMQYAKGLYLENNGTPEDETRSRKGEALNQSIRQRGIDKLEAHLLKNKDKRVRREILHRLSQMYEQQAEVISRRTDIKDKNVPMFTALRSSNRHLETLRREFPEWTPDAIIFNLAENHTKLKEDTIAEKYYREVIARFPKSPVVADSLLSLGNLYFERHHFEAARGFYNKILSTPEVNLHPYAHYKVAWCYFNESDISAAVAGLERAIMESRKISQGANKKLGVEEEALSDLVLFYAEKGDPSDAKAHFERLVDKEKANELRYNLARKLFDDGKHMMAKVTAKQLLDEGPQKEFVNKLYLILISVAERTKDREGGLATAEQLSKWLKGENLAKDSANRVETEEYMRHYSQKLHYEAETLKQGEVWAQAKKSYEIYLKTFPDEAETPEVKYRFSVLLMNRKEPFTAYKFVSESIAKIDAKHPRFQEALKLRLQAVEQLSKEDRKQIPETEIMAAYDAYATNFSKEDLGIEAAFKAAMISKNIDTPEKAAARFQALAEAHPEHSLAKSSVQEALAVLVKAQKWEALSQESKAFSTKSEIQDSLLGKDDTLRQKIEEARELANVKLTENLEQTGKLEEAKAQYEKILGEKPSDTLGIYAYVRLASLSEQKLNKARDAIKYFEGLRDRYPSSKEARQASLELARLFEKVNDPREAARRYREFADTGKGKLENQALTNSAVILENLGERESAAETFFRLAEFQKGTKDGESAYEAGCNNMLLASYQSKDKKVLRQIHDCARNLAASSEQHLQWQARAAWALDQMADSLQAEDNWKKLAGRSIKATPEAERAYVAMAKLKMLDGELAQFKEIRFSRTNERPEANIGKKTHAMDDFEAKAAVVIKIGTAKQILAARNALRLAYLDFAETMEAAAVPSTMSEGEQAELKKSFLTFAKGFREKAASFETKEEQPRIPASAEQKKDSELKIGSLSNEESGWIENGQIPTEKAAEVYAKKAFALYKDGKFGDARYFSEKWKKQASATAAPGYGPQDLEKFQAMLMEKLPDSDPVSSDF
ncbi:MAG: tetratricopeptide repeat protein, partial [Bdellovibrionota bacterium]